MPAGSSARSRPQVAGVRMRAPMMAINTVAAGGGSILHFDGARLRVGPDSAGADPGPACYRRGGPLTVTDANVCVGQNPAGAFPGDLWAQAATSRWMPRWWTKNSPRWPRRSRTPPAKPRSPHEVAEGFLRIAVANMANAIKQVSVQKGHDVTRFALQCFGGAGGQHACLVADALGMETVFIHPFAGRAVRLWHGPRRPVGDARAGGRSAADRRCHAGTGGAGRSAGGRCRRGAGQPGRRSRAHQHREHPASALCRHRGGADRCA